MSFTSTVEICDEFNIDPNQDTSQIIKALTQLQAELHPDKNPDFSDTDKQLFTRLEEAKSFLRENTAQTLIPLSQVLDIINAVKRENLSSTKESEIIADRITQTSEIILRTIKQQYLPSKITVTSISAVITLLWAFPSAVTEHPILGTLINNISYPNFYFLFTYFWLMSLCLSIVVLVFTYRAEQYTKNILHTLENPDNQFSIFSDFVRYLATSPSSSVKFTNKDLEKYILNHIRERDRSFRRRNMLPKYTSVHIKEIIPQISDMIIARGLEKCIISKQPNVGWYDTYIVN